MYQRLLLLLAVLCISSVAISQNVMNSGDGDNIYNSNAPLGSLTNPKALGTAPGALDTMQKWIRDPSQKNRIATNYPNFDQSTFKSYRWGTTSFRLRFPNNYDSTKKYPCVVFLHGAGEACPTSNSHNVLDASGHGLVNRENQDHLYWGADTFQMRINRGEWNGFLLFAQLYDNSTQWGANAGSNNSLNDVNSILDTLTKYNGLDPDRVVTMGLSAGGVGSVKYARLFPQRIAAVVAASPELISVEITDTDKTVIPNVLYLDEWKQIPIFMTSGGRDAAGDSDPPTMFKARDSIAAHGNNIYFGFYSNDDHNTWLDQWAARDVFNNYILTNYWNSAHKAQPVVYFQTTSFCSSQTISAKMGLTPGYYAYEWQMSNGGAFTTINGAASSDYTATQAGTYRVHFKRTSTSNWSAWTPNPVVITANACADTAFVEHFDEQTALINYVAATPTYGTTAYAKQNFLCFNGLFPNNTIDFTQDAAGHTGGRFMQNTTIAQSILANYPTTNCTYNVTDQVWRTFYPAIVQPNTNYTLSFYVGNMGNYFASGNADTYNALPLNPAYLYASVNGTVLTPAGGVHAAEYGDVSWKKYSYTWNSGTNNTTAEIAILNSNTATNGNDFVLDEISLVKYKKPAMPGTIASNVSLWSKAGSITGYNGSPVAVWNNDNINGFSLYQNVASQKPALQNDASDNVNFNPIVKYVAANNNILQIDSGISSSAVHNAVTAYMVTSISNLSQNSFNNILYEGQSSNGVVTVKYVSPGQMEWYAGSSTSNAIYTPNNSIEANKPIVWSFSKNNINGTASGNKQDIRKNGIVVASTNAATTFTGNNQNFSIGGFDGNIAEVIYLLDSTITPLTQNKVESYLALKYGTTLGNTTTPENYTASDSTTVFWTANGSYQNDVFGIGTDSASGLVQPVSNSVNSGSGDGTGQSAKGNLVLSTETSLNDKQFVMIGNDAGTLAQHIITSTEAQTIAVGSTRVGRNWKVANTNSTGVVDLSFDTTGLGNQAGGAVASNYALMIDLDGDGNYKTGTLAFFTATSASGKKIMFSGATLNNGAVFTIITFKLASALPATWLSFTAVAQNGNALLNWKTGDEINVDNYTVEHSFNGVSFSAVSSIAANNYSGTNSYTYTDHGLTPGTHYYRIRRTDLDGNNGLSDTKTIQITTTGANVQVMPNPVRGSDLILSVTVQQNSKSNLQVMGVDGKIIVHQNVNLASGNNMLNVNISNVPPGIYLVQVQLNDEVVTKKFVKER